MGRWVAAVLVLALCQCAALSAPGRRTQNRPTGSRPSKRQQAERVATDGPTNAGKESTSAGLLSSLRQHASNLLLALPRLGHRMWLSLPDKMPSFWRVEGLTTKGAGKALFMLSNVAYLVVVRSLLLRGTQDAYGWSILGVCLASCGYHAAQCLHGADSAHAARWCTVDTALTIAVAIAFGSRATVNPENLGYAVLSLAFFYDVPRLGYTTSHSLWHFSTAACALTTVVEPPEKLVKIVPYRAALRKLPRLTLKRRRRAA